MSDCVPEAKFIYRPFFYCSHICYNPQGDCRKISCKISPSTIKYPVIFRFINIVRFRFPYIVLNSIKSFPVSDPGRFVIGFSNVCITSVLIHRSLTCNWINLCVFLILTTILIETDPRLVKSLYFPYKVSKLYAYSSIFLFAIKATM